jgi:hypothetical protein
MNDELDPRLEAELEAWRQSSRREPRRHARERALDAMTAALAAPEPRARPRGFRPRFRHAGLLAGAGGLVVAVVVAAAGWDAAPGSALFVIRAARQGVMLKLPGSDEATLHLQFAEQSLREARAGVDPEQSLANARSELAAALATLPSDRTSPLWARYASDEQALLAAESLLDIEGPSPSPGVVIPGSTTPRSTDEPTNSPSGQDVDPTSRPNGSPSPSAGDDHRGSGSPSPSGSPNPGE